MNARPVRPPPASRLSRWISAWAGIKAVVWGDFVLDEYWRCRSSRVSREAPVLVLDFESRSIQCGGAANAALNLAALGARVFAVGWVGRDPHGRELRALLENAGVTTAGLLEHFRGATVVKTRIVAGSSHTARQQVVRVDRGSAFVATAGARRSLLKALDRAARGARAVVLSDYGYDSVTPRLSRSRIRRWRARRAIVGLDARYRLAEYHGVSIATPNESEAAHASGIGIANERDLARAAARLLRRLDARHLVITRGRDGLTLWNREASSLEAWGGREAVDVTGAGDAVVAAATLALAAGAPGIEAAALANVAGSVAVSRRGAVAVSAGDLAAALKGKGRPRRARRRT
ncbi:MAG: sugar kinase [Candidatus Eisenbacteria bacterium]|nr:sugar kinase [Candidatus Eisenbacteria bacterium]